MAKKKKIPNLLFAGNAIGLAMILYVFCSQLVRFLGKWVLGVAFTVPNGFTDAPAWAFGLFSILVPIASFVPAILFLKKQGKAYGLRIELTFGEFPIKLLIPLFLGSMMVVNALTSIFRSILLDAFKLPLDRTIYFPETTTGKFFYFIAVCLLAPFFEELFFRGAVQGMLRPFGRKFAMIVASAFFTLMHTNILELPGIFALSIILAYTAEITGSVFPCIALHFTNNVYSFTSLWARNRLEGMAALAFSFWVVLLVMLFFTGSIFMVRQQGIGKKLFLEKQEPQVSIKHKSKVLLKAPIFMAGCMAILGYFILRIFVLN